MDEETRAILTPAQAKRFDELRSERDRHPHQGPGHFGPPGDPPPFGAPPGPPPNDGPADQPH
jgi:hypothetical protein